MATVYLAEDLKHDRKVALKVLRPELAAVLGADRFVQEIKTTASLQHPHILPLYDSGRAGGQAGGRAESPGEFLYYVMPYIQGETLREKLDREHQLGIEEAVRITSEVADALEYAHEQGVIHRDVKPENILLHNGRAMVADFGIALAVSAAAGGRMTETGLSLGTPHYMSPEQATAEKEITARSDVYSLGSVLYEMLTGEPPHTGGSAQAIIMKIVTEEAAPVTRVRKSVPPNVAAAVTKALERLPADRFDTAKGFAEALHNPAFATAVGTVGTVGTVGAAGTAAPSRRWPAITYVFAGVAVIALTVAAWSLLRQPAPPPVVWYEMGLPERLGRLLDIPTVAMTPDGSRIIYAAEDKLWIRSRASLRANSLPGVQSAVNPVVSPDGKNVAFLSIAPARLRTVPLAGGTATTVIDSGVPTYGFAWGDDGYLYLGYDDGLRRIPATGGTIETVLSDSGGARWPDVLPGSKVVLFTTWVSGESHIVALDVEAADQHELTAGAMARYAATGHLLVATPQGTLTAARFDVGALTVGAPVSIVDDLRVQPAGFADLVIGAEGRLVYVAGPSRADAVDEAVWVARDGSVTPVDPTWKFSSSGNSGWALSPDGTRLAIKLNGQEGQDIWIKDFRNGALQRVTFDDADDYRPSWSPGGRSITFISDRAGNGQSDVYERRADGTGAARLLLDLPEPIPEARWAPDGRWLLARLTGATSISTGTRDVWGKRMVGDTATVPLLASPADERAVAFSPNGRWLAYMSDASGSNEVYIRPFPDVRAGQWQVSLDGGSAPLWAHNGRELFYVNRANEMLVADLTNGPGSIGARKVLFSLDGYRLSTNYTWYDVSPDDQRFLMVRESPTSGRLIVVDNFFEELREKVGK